MVILTTFGADGYISRALGDGASGFLLKAGDPRELITGVHAVAGGAYLSPQVARQVIAQFGDGRAAREAAATARIGELTQREGEVLALVGAGLSNADIADRLFLV